MERGVIIEKRIEFFIGLFFLIPPILGVVAFVLSLFGNQGDFSNMWNLSNSWTTSGWCYHIPVDPFEDEGVKDTTSVGGAGMSAAPIYLGFMAMAGVALIKNTFRYFFMRSKKHEHEVKK